MRFILSAITAIPVLVNIFYVVVCFTTLKKKFHNLLVLMLCVGDSILSTSLTMYSLTKMIDMVKTNLIWCIIQTFGVCYGLVFTYTIVFWICCERYVVVKNYNFGAQHFFERFKLVIIGGSIALGFLFTIELVTLVPKQQTIESCTVPNLYGNHLNFFIQFIAGILTSFMAAILFLSIRTSMLIWKYFFRSTRTGAINRNGQESLEMTMTEDDIPCECKHCRLQNNYVSTTDNKEWTSVDLMSNEMSEENTKSYEMSKRINEIVTQLRKDREGGNDQILITPKSIVQKTLRKIKPSTWEKRAFITTIIIAVTTIFLTGPFIFSFWLDFFYGTRFTSQKTRLLLFVPLVLNSIINPFIYAWRIPEIKQRIKKIFTCCKE
ncbi:unnamed protein product [Mytilus coruscus]|uniref:G-protein coupled receptors family 1 profile domain-containing protein n=1 Tax=Mytilus coruscus TaxID=42192 RepID=A0A6J8C8P1_MYTCO|nr:unnamed protein product [Mytilus coruscus]